MTPVSGYLVLGILGSTSIGQYFHLLTALKRQPSMAPSPSDWHSSDCRRGGVTLQHLQYRLRETSMAEASSPLHTEAQHIAPVSPLTRVGVRPER